jgi:DnaJ-class molecular chaperone
VKISQARKKLENMSVEERKNKGYKTCLRCSGSGNHSYNPIHGSTCFKCNGLGYVKITK